MDIVPALNELRGLYTDFQMHVKKSCALSLFRAKRGTLLRRWSIRLKLDAGVTVPQDKTPQSFFRALPWSSPLRPAASVPDVQDQLPSRRQRFVPGWRHGNRVRKRPDRLPARSAPADQTPGRSGDAMRRGHTRRFQDQVPGRARRWQNRESALQSFGLLTAIR